MSGKIKTSRQANTENFRSILTILLKGIRLVLIIFALVTIYISIIGSFGIVNGDSMSPTLYNGDLLYIDKLSFKFVQPKRFDIAVFPNKSEYGELLIKRIIGLPGETVQIRDGSVYINGKILKDISTADKIKNAGIAGNEIVLDNDEYFMLGDNRNNSLDSRDNRVGIINASEISGTAWFCFWPLTAVSFLSSSHLPFIAFAVCIIVLLILCQRFLFSKPKKNEDNPVLLQAERYLEENRFDTAEILFEELLKSTNAEDIKKRALEGLEKCKEKHE